MKMNLQRWIVYKKEDGKRVNIGTVVTNMEGTNEIAWNKAAHKYLLGKPYTIGWSMHVEKAGIK
jgi:hypothetical protein